MIKDSIEGKKLQWNDILSDFFYLDFNPETEKLLLDVLSFEGRFNLDETGEMPHSLSPEDMLKSLAIQMLAKNTGKKHLEVIKQIGLINPNLSSIVKAVNDVILGCVPLARL